MKSMKPAEKKMAQFMIAFLVVAAATFAVMFWQSEQAGVRKCVAGKTEAIGYLHEEMPSYADLEYECRNGG